MRIVSINWGREKEDGIVTGTYVEVETDEDFEERVFHLESPPRLVLDLLGGELGNQTTEIPVSDPLLRKIRVGQFNPDILRVVMDLTVSGPFCISYPQDNKIRFSIEQGSLPQEPQILIGKVTLDPGHGGSSPGAVGPDGQPEKAINLAVALKAEKMLKEQGVEVIMTRRDDSYVSLANRAETVNSNDCDLVVSIHCNSFTLPNAYGTETYHFPSSKNGRLLASYLQQDLVSKLKRRDRGVKSADFYILRETVPPAALVELAFLSNPTEAKLLRDSGFQEKAAQAITAGVMKFLKNITG